MTFGEQEKRNHILDLLIAPLGGTARSDWRTQSRVPSMWWTNSEFEIDGIKGLRQLLLPSAIIGLFFGAVHCIAWKFYFPTIMERTLWRVCAVAVGIGPALVLLIGLGDPRTSLFLFLGLPLLYLAFFAARTGLLVLSLMALREIPTSAYQTVPWLSYIPHL